MIVDSDRVNLQKVIPQILYKDILTTSSTCSICLEDFKLEEIVSLTNCKHIFHNQCIEKWKNNTCPMCRNNLDSSIAQ